MAEVTATIRVRVSERRLEVYVGGVLVVCRDGDDVKVDRARRVFPERTTPLWRALRSLFECYAHEIVSAITDGASGALIEASARAGRSPAERAGEVAWMLSDAAEQVRQIAEELAPSREGPQS